MGRDPMLGNWVDSARDRLKLQVLYTPTVDKANHKTGKYSFLSTTDILNPKSGLTVYIIHYLDMSWSKIRLKELKFELLHHEFAEMRVIF